MNRENDAAGKKTLERFSKATSFNRWLYENISPYCRGRIVEAGSGIGNISELLLEKNTQVTLSDLRQDYCNNLKKRFGQDPHLDGVYQLDISNEDFENQYKDLLEKFDTVIALNVVEHIKDDKKVIANCKKLLGQGGMLIILVPAYQWLYNNFDRELEHYRRYNKEQTTRLMENAGLKVIRNNHFNLAAIPGWWFSGTLLQKKIIPEGQLRFFNFLVPFFRLLDKITFQKAGLSIITIALNQPKSDYDR